VTVKPRPSFRVEISAGQPHYLAAAALAGEAVLVFEAAGEHLGDPADLHVQRPGSATIHAVPRIAPRQAEQLGGRCELLQGLVVDPCEREHRLLEQLEGELAVAAGAAANAESAAVGLKMDSHSH
jgi:hypothetical protein